MTYQFNAQETSQKQYHKYSPFNVPDVLSKEQIADVEKIAQNAQSQIAKIGGGANGIENTTVRRTQIKWLTPEIMPQEFAKYFEQIITKINVDNYEFAITGMEAFQYSVYEASNAGHYYWHADMMPIENNVIRKISMSLLLNDTSEYEGGNLLFNLDGNIVVAQEKIGQAIFFPSWIPHCVTPVTKGVRKSLVNWIHGPKFK